MKKIKIKDMIIIAFFATLTSVFSQIYIPFFPVNINFSLLSVFLAGGILTSSQAVLSQVVYVLLGAVGIPVFSGFGVGLPYLFGMKGGYIWGYILAVFVISFSQKMFNQKFLYLSIFLGLISCYTLGTAWFIFISKTSVVEAFFMCVFPYLIGDFFKILLTVFLVKKLRKILKTTPYQNQTI